VSIENHHRLLFVERVHAVVVVVAAVEEEHVRIVEVLKVPEYYDVEVILYYYNA
jgi:hypothetical protein